MSKIFNKFIPSELINGEEYTRDDLGKIFDSPEIINHFGGIIEIKNCTVLLMTLDKSVLAELPKEIDEMEREEIGEHSYKHLDYFDTDEKIFGWDGPTTMNIESPLLKRFMAQSLPCLLFVREYYAKNKNDRKKGIVNKKYVYCGPIKYLKHYDSNPPHFICSVDEFQEKPNKKLKALYNYQPVNLDTKLKDFETQKNKYKDEFEELLKQEESRTLERKSTFFGGSEYRGFMVDNCIKAIAGFLNGRGGNLLVGVEDDGVISGVEKDCNYTNQDRYQIKIMTKIGEKVSDFANIERYIRLTFHKVTTHQNINKIVLQINCRPTPPRLVAFVGEKVHLRQGNLTNTLTAKQAIAWMKERDKL